MTSIITLTTDFGTRDHYVAQLKAVLYARGPSDLRVVDLSHEIAPHAVREAAFFLRFALPRFPAGTIHLAVVDPGVGSARLPLAAECEGQYLLAPDNGSLSWVLDASARFHRIEHDRAVAPTFHGRDVFAPAAARLARGEDLSALGPAVREIVRFPWPEPSHDASGSRGVVVHVDRFGNLITNLRAEALLPGAQVSVGPTAIGQVQSHYAQVAPAQLLALIGSEGLLEVAARDASAATILGAGVGSGVTALRTPG
jgi:S-adenosylmethionine hydrolase